MSQKERAQCEVSAPGSKANLERANYNPAGAEGKALARIAELLHGASAAEKFLAQHVRWQEIRALQRRLAEEFGARRGWRLTRSDFGPRTLALQRQRVYLRTGIGLLPEWHWPHSCSDHAFYYRVVGRAAGMVAHLYDVPSDLDEWATEQGLRASILAGSWWYPGWTVMVLYEAAEAAIGGPAGLRP